MAEHKVDLKDSACDDVGTVLMSSNLPNGHKIISVMWDGGTGDTFDDSLYEPYFILHRTCTVSYDARCIQDSETEFLSTPKYKEFLNMNAEQSLYLNNQWGNPLVPYYGVGMKGNNATIIIDDISVFDEATWQGVQMNMVFHYMENEDKSKRRLTFHCTYRTWS